MNYKIYCDGAASNNGYENAIGGWAYVILDEKIAVFDTVDAVLNGMAEYLKKI